jgi:hypothetical protein
MRLALRAVWRRVVVGLSRPDAVVDLVGGAGGAILLALCSRPQLSTVGETVRLGSPTVYGGAAPAPAMRFLSYGRTDWLAHYVERTKRLVSRTKRLASCVDCMMVAGEPRRS